MILDSYFVFFTRERPIKPLTILSLLLLPSRTVVILSFGIHWKMKSVPLVLLHTIITSRWTRIDVFAILHYFFLIICVIIDYRFWKRWWHIQIDVFLGDRICLDKPEMNADAKLKLILTSSSVKSINDGLKQQTQDDAYSILGGTK